MTRHDRKVLRLIVEGKRLAATLATLESVANLAEAGLVQVERDPVTRSPVAWVATDAGKAST
jgi:hypothetical protein